MIVTNVLGILNAAATIQFLAGQGLKGAAALAVRRIAIKMQPELASACYARDSLYTDQNSVSAPDGRRSPKPECISQVIQDPLFSMEVRLDCAPLTPDDLLEATISAQQLDELGAFFKEDQ